MTVQVPETLLYQEEESGMSGARVLLRAAHPPGTTPAPHAIRYRRLFDRGVVDQGRRTLRPFPLHSPFSV